MAKLYVIATPIGNMEDISYRAVRLLNEIDVLACEDTRVTKKILTRYEVRLPTQIFSYHEHNEQRAITRIISHLENEEDVAICSDAGMPGISDPGYKLISRVIDEGHDLDVIPGPSSVHNALVQSGLPTSSYTFKGFIPRKEGQRQKFFEIELAQAHTLVFFESKHRIIKSLTQALSVYGDRYCAVCLELTKKFEQTTRGYMSDVIPKLEQTSIKGEITLVIAGNHPKFIRTDDEES